MKRIAEAAPKCLWRCDVEGDVEEEKISCWKRRLSGHIVETKKSDQGGRDHCLIIPERYTH